MNVRYESSFARDLKRIKDANLRRRIAALIVRLEAASDLSEIDGVKKLKGASDAFRLRMGDYRLGFLLRDGDVDRKEMYRHFP